MDIARFSLLVLHVHVCMLIRRHIHRIRIRYMYVHTLICAGCVVARVLVSYFVRARLHVCMHINKWLCRFVQTHMCMWVRWHSHLQDSNTKEKVYIVTASFLGMIEKYISVLCIAQ